MRLQDDQLAAGEAQGAFAQKADVSVQVSPGFVIADDTGQGPGKLRACFVCIPDDQAAEKWRYSGSNDPLQPMCEEVIVQIDALEASHTCTVDSKTLHPWNDDTVSAVSAAIWDRVMTPRYDATAIGRLREFVRTPPPASRDDPDIWKSMRLPAHTRPSSFGLRAARDPGGDFTISGLSVIQRSLVKVHLATMMTRALDKDGPTLSSATAAELFSARERPKASAGFSALGIKFFADRAQRWASRIASRGGEASADASLRANEFAESAFGGPDGTDRKPFHRLEPDPGPDLRPSEEMVGVVNAIVSDIGARAWHLAAGLEIDAGPARWADTVDVNLTEALEDSLEKGTSGPVLNRSEMSAILQQVSEPSKMLLTLVQLGLRPDANDRSINFIANLGQPQKELASERLAGSEFAESLSFEEAEFIITQADNTIQNRIGGLLALPIAARIARLVFDFEIDLATLPESLRDYIVSGQPFTVKVCPAATGQDINVVESRTACRLVQMPNAPGNHVFVPCEEKEDRNPEQKDGILNLQQKIDGRNRFHFSSTDLAGFVNRTWNEGEAEAARIASGYDSEAAPGSLRSSGVALYDNAADLAAHRTMSRAKSEIRYANDICTGYRVDVGVQPRHKRGGDDGWRSLCRKTLTFKNESRSNCALEELTTAADTMRQAIAGTGIYSADELDFLLNETTVRPGARTVRDENDAEQAILFDMVFEWMGDPLATSCTAKRPAAWPDSRNDGFESVESISDENSDGGTDAVVHFEEGLPVVGKLPPRLEYQRNYNFGMRAVYLGGYSLPLELASELYRGAKASYTMSHRHLRMENMPAPQVFELPGAMRHGETLDTLAVRNSFGRDSSRRLIAVPSVALDMAAMHPTPEAVSPDANYRGPWRVLDDRERVRGKKHFPAGGWPFVSSMALKPKQGESSYTESWDANPLRRIARGAPENTRRDRKLFSVGDVSQQQFNGRAAQYYPDPMVDRLRLQLVDPRDESVVEQTDFPVYDRNYFQATHQFIDRKQMERCEYPNAIPILFELRRNASENIFDDTMGYLDQRSRFHKFRGNERRPPKGTLTVRRVRVSIARGADLELRCNCLRHSKYNEGFGPHSLAREMLVQTGKFEKGADALLAAFGGDVSRLEDFASDQLSLRLVHAVEQPDAPVLSQVAALRKTLDENEWRKKAKGLMENPEKSSDLGASQTWLKGDLNVEGAVTGGITLSVAYSDLRYDPYKAIEVDKSGEIVFERLAPYTVEIDLAREQAGTIQPREIKLVDEGLRDRPAVLQLPDSRAYELEITPLANSRHRSFFHPDTTPAEFVNAGETKRVWVKATKRPASLAFVEMLPVFVWEERSKGISQSRRMALRLRWRNKLYEKGSPLPEGGAAGWPSSGKNEELGIVLRGSGSTGDLEQFVSQVGGDAIRTGGDASESLTLEDLLNFSGTREREVFVPAPGKADGATQAIAREDGAMLDVLRYQPRYEPIGRYWYVDLDIGNPERIPAPLDVGAPWVRLGLARFQEHALQDEHEFRDLRASTPSVLEFRLEPFRRVDVVAGRAEVGKDGKKRWPIDVIVYGRKQYLQEHGSARDTKYDASRFDITLLKKPYTAVDWFAEGGLERAETACDQTTHCIQDSDPSNGVLWRERLWATKSPRRGQFYVLVEEVEEMLSAYATSDEPGAKCDSGPRFMAKIRVRG